MYRLVDDYSEGCHPKILDALSETNLVQLPGYGLDTYSKFTEDKVKEIIRNKDVDVHFLMGGTQTNLVFISSALRSYEAVIAVDSAHINVHETGAIENTGHKIITKPNIDGKLTITMIKEVLNEHDSFHMVQPKLVFISQSTEYGSTYTLEELKELYLYCQMNNLYLFIDGARLITTLTLDECPNLEEITNYCDAYYIGGTKAGCLFGECLVIKNELLKINFKYQMKQHGAMLAKGRLLGVQFHALFTNDLYLEIAEHQNSLAHKIRQAIINLGYEFYVESNSNQLFPIFPENVIESLKKEFIFNEVESFFDGTKCIRIVTSWATIPHKVDRFIEILRLTK